MAYIALVIAILCEVVATSSLKAADGFTRLAPSAVVIVGYALSLYFLSVSLRAIPVGAAYAVWSGLGTVAIAVLGWKIYGQSLDLAAVIGIGLIIAGVLVLNLMSSSVSH